MVSKIVRELESQGESEVSSETIGETVMAYLRELDDVAYVRFASVYRNFREAKDFETALAELSSDETRGIGGAGAQVNVQAPGARAMPIAPAANEDVPAASADARFMALALTLGRRGLGRTWPNPAVGAVSSRMG